MIWKEKKQRKHKINVQVGEGSVKKKCGGLEKFSIPFNQDTIDLLQTMFGYDLYNLLCLHWSEVRPIEAGLQ